MTYSEDPTSALHIAQINQYDLLLIFNTEGVKMLIYNKLKILYSKRDFTFEGFYTASAEEIIQLLEGINELRLNFHSIRLICESERYTFVPLPFFKVADTKVFLEFQQLLTEKEVPLYNKIANREMVNIFSLAGGLHRAFVHLFPNIEIEHHQSYFITDIMTKVSEVDAVHLSVRKKSMDVIVLKNDGFQFLNSIEYHTPEDLTYFILNIYDQLNLNIDKDHLQLYNTQINDPIHKSLERYIKTIHLHP